MWWRWRKGPDGASVRTKQATAALMVLVANVITAAPAASEPPTVLLVVDGSGSMWGKIEGERLAKLYMARDALKSLLPRIPAATRVGLASFGHRRQGDCGDVEMVLKPDAGGFERLQAPLEKLNARGRGPITNALREAAKELGPQSAPASVILIHDDNDNCQMDPCSAVGDLRRAHPKVVVHVIALGMKKEEAQRIACLAKATGGKHFEVATQAQMLLAVEEALKFSSAEGQLPTPERTAAQPPAAAPLAPENRPGVQLSATLSTTGEPIDLPLRWRITRSGDATGAAVWEGDAAAPLIELPTGRYDVEAWLGFVKARSAIDAVAGQRRSLALALGAGTVRFGPLAPKSQALMRDALITFRRVDGEASETLAIQRGPETEVALLAGSYIVSVTVGSLRIDRGIIIRPGDRLPFQPSLNFGELELSALSHTGGPAVEGAEFSLFEDDPDAPQGRREIARSAASGPRFVLPPGTYYAVARIGTVEARERVTVKPGETESRALPLDLARLTLTARLIGARVDITEPVTHRLERVGGEARDVLYANRAASTLQLAAGRYRIETRIGSGNVRAEREIELKPGAREQVVVELAAGLLTLRLLDGVGGTAQPDVAWDIRDAQGRTVWIGNQTEARPLLMAGRYTVRATTRQRRSERAVEVRASEIRAYDLTSQ